MEQEIETNKIYSANHVSPYPIVITEAEGIYAHDSKGNTYIDMVSGISSVNFGHKHPRLIKTLVNQASKVAVVPRLFHNKPLSQLLEAACQLTDMEKALPMNSGAEALETAVKIARKWAYTVKKIGKDKAEIIACNNNFHGRTITAISLSSTDKYKENFGPLTPGFKLIPFNDPKALENIITKNSAAFIVEPIQGEGGVLLPDETYLKQCEAICKRHNVLFIVDEIQTGMGRTGKPLASQHQNVKPDGILLGKSLGGGLLPISLFLAKSELMDVIEPGEHGGTFGGNPLASAVAYEAINVLIDENISQQAAETGAYFLEQLKKIDSPAIIETRGKGLFIAIELDKNIITAQSLCQTLMEKGLLTINTHNKALRLLPPLNITIPQIDDSLAIIKQALNNLKNI